MQHHHKHSGFRDYNSASHYSTEQSPFYYDWNQTKEENNRKRQKLKRCIEELKSNFDRQHLILRGKLMEMMKIIEKLESMHKATTVGSIAGSSMGAAGGITAIVGLALSPVTLGASLIVTAAGVGVAAAGGATRSACNLANMMKQENLCEAIDVIINDFMSMIDPIIEQFTSVYKTIEEIREMEQGMRGMQADERAATDAAASSGVEGSRNMKVFKHTVSSFNASERSENIFNVAAQADKVTPAVTTLTAVVSALFVVFDVIRIAQSTKEIATVNKNADKRKAKEIKSDTLKHIQLRSEIVACFQDILNSMKSDRDNLNKELQKL